MEERSSRHRPSRLGVLRPTIGEIVEVQGGGRIIRSTGRKDRHSKVCTARGPRDRRVRLAAHTAIQFYDVQDRLGYDRPSKAVDWLIKKAKAAIDELKKLSHADVTEGFEAGDEGAHNKLQQAGFDISNSSLNGEDNQHNENKSNFRAQNSNSNFLPPSSDSDVITDTIKSFFPTETASSSSMQFQSFPTPDLRNRSQDLKLSLQTFRDPILFQNPNDYQSEQPQVLLSGIPLGFDATAAWAEQCGEISRYQKLSAWNFGGDAASGGAPVHQSAGHLFNSPLQQLLGRNQIFSQRGPLQSSNTPSIRTWMDPSMAEHNQQQQNYHKNPLYPSSGFTFSGLGGCSVPVRIQGDEEEHDGYSDKLSSATSDSRC